MGDISHERFLLLGSVGPGTFVENGEDGTQIGHINYTRRNCAYEVRLNIRIASLSCCFSYR